MKTIGDLRASNETAQRLGHNLRQVNLCHEGGRWNVYDDDAIDHFELDKIIIGTYGTATLYQEWYAVEIQYYSGTCLSVDGGWVLARVRRESVGHVGILVWRGTTSNAYMPPGHRRVLYDTIWFHNEADAVNARMTFAEPC